MLINTLHECSVRTENGFELIGEKLPEVS